MKKNVDLDEAVPDCWIITGTVSEYLIGNIDRDLWDRKIPGYPRKTIGMLAAHLHNVRCMWINAIGKGFVKVPARIDPGSVTRKEVRLAMKRSSDAILALLKACIANGGSLPVKPSWLNFPNDIVHLLAYFVAHEAHHRGQIVMAARQLGQPFSRSESAELWQWTRREFRKQKPSRLR